MKWGVIFHIRTVLRKKIALTGRLDHKLFMLFNKLF